MKASLSQKFRLAGIAACILLVATFTVDMATIKSMKKSAVHLMWPKNFTQADAACEWIWPAFDYDITCSTWGSAGNMRPTDTVSQECKNEFAQEWLNRPGGDGSEPLEIVHMIWTSSEDRIFPARILLAIESILVNNPTLRIMLHGDVPPEIFNYLGEYKGMRSRLELRDLDLEELIASTGGVGVAWWEHYKSLVAWNRVPPRNVQVHQADFVRLLVVYKYGGIYVDADYMFHAPFPYNTTQETVLANCCVLDKEEPDREFVDGCQGQCSRAQGAYQELGKNWYMTNGILWAPKKSLYLRLILEQLDQTGYYNSRRWSCIGLRAMARVHKRIQSLIGEDLAGSPLREMQAQRVMPPPGEGHENTRAVAVEYSEEGFAEMMEQRIGMHGDLWQEVKKDSIMWHIAHKNCVSCGCVEWALKTQISYDAPGRRDCIGAGAR